MSRVETSTPARSEEPDQPERPASPNRWLGLASTMTWIRVGIVAFITACVVFYQVFAAWNARFHPIPSTVSNSGVGSYWPVALIAALAVSTVLSARGLRHARKPYNWLRWTYSEEPAPVPENRMRLPEEPLEPPWLPFGPRRLRH